MRTQAHPDLTRTFLVILILAALIVGSLWTLLPFLSALVWATTVVVATWPLLLAVQARLHGRRLPAVVVMTVVMFLVFIVPFAAAVLILLQAAVEGVDLIRAATTDGLPAAPAWLDDVPWVGSRLVTRWQALAAGGPEAVTEALRPFARSTAGWALAITGGFGVIVVHFVLAVVLSAILYAQGETAATGLLMFARRVGADRGELAMRLAGQAVRGVALGVVLTALAQSAIAGLGLWIAGVPRPGLLLSMIFVLCIAQIGPLPVLIPAVVWLFWSGSVGWGTVLLVFAAVVSVADNILKPVLIRRGVDLPLLLIVAGVIGGLIGFGVLGLFIGPVLLAVTYTLLESWVRQDETTVGVSSPTRPGEAPDGRSL